MLIEEVFGEFRPTIYSIFDALHNRDYRLAADRLGELERQMFDVE